MSLESPQRIVFLDETGAKTNMARLYGRARKGIRAWDDAPHGHWNTTTLVAAITCNGAESPMLLEGPMDREAFDVYIEQVLVPALRPGQIVVMDNLSPHKTPRVAALIQAVGAELRYLPPYSPDLNPIELMWSKVKTFLRSARARTQEALYEATRQALESVTPEDATAWFKHCGVGIIS